MSRAIRTPILTALALALVFGGAAHLFGTAAHAQAFGRITLLVKDLEGNPVEGVKITATQDELAKFRVEELTNKKGKAVFSVADATKVYNFLLEYEGYPSLDLQFKPAVRGNVTREVTFDKGQARAEKDESGKTQVVYTPAERVFNEGVEALQAGDMATAKEKFLAALDKDSKMVGAHSAVAAVYLEEENYPEALASIDRLLALEPDNTRALRMRYEAHKGLGNDKEAKEALDALAKLDTGGDTTAMLYNEGVQAARVGDLKAARARFEDVLAIDPNMIHALTGVAFVYMNEKSYQEAATTAEKILGLEPGNAKALQLRYDAYRGLGDKATATEAMKALAAVNPAAMIEQLFNQGVELFNAGDGAAAVERFESVLELDPEHALAHYRLGVSQVGSNPASAKEHLQKFIELAPDHAEAPVAKDMLSYLQ